MSDFIASRIITPILPFFLTFVATVLYIDLRFFPFLKARKTLTRIFRRTDHSAFSALAVALAGTLGVGNIVGVAYAVTEGGAGALFWMWVSAFLAMIIKYAETVLAIRHRRDDPEDKNKLPALRRHIGGAMYFIPHRLPASLFSLLCLFAAFTVGNMLQTKALSDAMSESFSLSPIVTGTAIALLTLLVTYRGIARITKFCAFTIPFLSLVYLGMCAVILIKNASALPAVMKQIFTEAFSAKAIEGGITGSLFFQGLRVGFSKGLITNEAGCGTAPIAHASSNVKSAAEQGVLGIIEVFFDTVVLCTASGLVFLLALSNAPSKEGYSLVYYAFTSLFGKSAAILLPLSIFFFVLATLVGWSYYGKCALDYFTRKPLATRAYLFIFSVFALLGACGNAEKFFSLSDVALGLMTFINTGYILTFRREIKEETHLYFQN